MVERKSLRINKNNVLETFLFYKISNFNKPKINSEILRYQIGHRPKRICILYVKR